MGSSSSIVLSGPLYILTFMFYELSEPDDDFTFIQYSFF